MKNILTILILFMALAAYGQCPDDKHPHVIDLGLPSGKGWACCNVCATSPEDFGGYFAYGEYWEKPSYSKQNYTYGEDLGFGYYIWDNIGTNTNISGSAGYDVAYKIMGPDWRMPTKTECQELVDSCIWEWTSVYGNTGYKVTGPSGNYIFIPAAGFKSGFNHNKIGERGIYRSSMWTILNGEASSSYAIDFTQNGVEVNNLGYRVNGLTVRPIFASGFDCTVEKAFDDNLKGNNAKGFTADGISEIAITYRTGYAILDDHVDISFYIDEQEIDSKKAGTIKDISFKSNSVTIILQAPEDYMFNDKPDYEVKMEVTPYYLDKPLAKAYYKYRILRPGVLFFHGLGDNKTLFDKTISSLLSKNMYVGYKNKEGSPQLISIDYSDSNTSSFEVNTNEKAVVKNACNLICNTLFENDSIVSSRYDMVGHSMGGILARLYAQQVENGKESTNRIITLNTPHYGSMLGNAYIAIRLFEVLQAPNPLSLSLTNFSYVDFLLTHTLFKDDNSLDAITDLAIGSRAIQTLNGEKSKNLVGVPVHSICTYIDFEDNENEVSQPSFNVETKIGLVDRLIKRIPTKKLNLLSASIGDGVVSLSSQQGGLQGDKASIFEGTYNNAFHCNSPKWDYVINEVGKLIEKERESEFFSLTGFCSEGPSKIRIVGDEEGDEYIEGFEEVRDGSFISADITYVENEDYTHLFTVQCSPDMMTYEVFAIFPDSSVIYSVDMEKSKFNIPTVPENGIKFYVVGRTDYNAILLDSIVVNQMTDDMLHNKLPLEKKAHMSFRNKDVIVCIPSIHNNSVWELYSIDGTLVNSGVSSQEKIILDRKETGVYVLKVTDDGVVHSFKLLLHD